MTAKQQFDKLLKNEDKLHVKKLQKVEMARAIVIENIEQSKIENTRFSSQVTQLGVEQPRRNFVEIVNSILACDFALTPKVHAKEPPPSVPQKPDPMRPSELPIHESPHATYLEYAQEKKYACAPLKLHPPHYYLNPLVTETRETLQDAYKNGRAKLRSIYENTKSKFNQKFDEVVKYVRDEKNVSNSRALVTLGAVTGYTFVRKNRSYTIRFANALGGAGIMGALCFPKETDNAVRALGSAALSFIDMFCTVFYGGSYYNDRCSKDFVFEDEDSGDRCFDDEELQRRIDAMTCNDNDFDDDDEDDDEKKN